MKKYNKYLVASLLLLYADGNQAHEHGTKKDSIVGSINQILDQIETTELQSGASAIVPQVSKNIEQPARFFTYQDHHNLKSIESIPLQQQNGDVIESVAFNFEDIDLQNIAKYMERIHNVTIITDDILDSNKNAQKMAGNKVSFRTNAPLSKQESWNLFITFLSMAGLDIIPMSHSGFYRIVPLPNASQEAIPAYIGSHPDILPDNNMVVRYVYFLQYADPLKVQPVISKFQGNTGSLVVYKELKALIFTDKSCNIKSLMNIVKEMDKQVSPQVMSVLKLKKANVEDVTKLYESLKPQNNQRAWAPDTKDPASEFFAQNVQLVGDKRTNTLIILGPKDGVARLEDFIIKHVDISTDEPKSPVYVYYLEYTNAVNMEKTLGQLVTYASQSSAAQYGGVRDGQKYVQPMTIVADNYSNSLIINATPEDYAIVEQLIKQLDVPQKQVAIEVLLVQVTGQKVKEFGSQISGPNANNTFLPSISAQTSGIPQINEGSNVVTTPGGNGLAESIKSNLASLLMGTVNQAGSTLLTFGQPIWAVFKVLKTIAYTKIIQNPFMLTSNNCEGQLKVGVSRRVVTGEAVSSGTTSTTGFQTAEANLSISIVPQVNDQRIVNLSIQIENNQFVNSGDNDAVQDQKSITTIASVADGEVLVLGGIMADSTSSATSGVPFFAKIPLFGWLFKNKGNRQANNIFMVFICPKILDNVSSQKELQEFSRQKIEETQDYLRLMDEAESIDAGQDPLDKLFFGNNSLKSDDLTAQRLLNKGELVSTHYSDNQQQIVGKIPYSKYHKKSQEAVQQKNNMVTKKQSISKKNKQTQVQSSMNTKKDKYALKHTDQKSVKKTHAIASLDLSEIQYDEVQNVGSIGIKNMVQQSVGVS